MAAPPPLCTYSLPPQHNTPDIQPTFLAFSAASCARFSLVGMPTALELTAATNLQCNTWGSSKAGVVLAVSVGYE